MRSARNQEAGRREAGERGTGEDRSASRGEGRSGALSASPVGFALPPASTSPFIIIIIVSALGLVFAAPCSAVAGIYHVAQKHPDASDENPGTAERPWKTIARAAEALRPGDTARIHAGLYREAVRPARSGTAESPITYAAADGEEVVITGADVVAGWTKVEGEVWKKAPWRHRFATHPDDERHRLIGRCEQVIFEGRLVRQVAAVSDMERGTFCALPGEEALYIRLEDGASPEGRLVEASVRPVCFGLGWGGGARHHIRLRGLTIRFAANMAQRGAIWAHGDGWSLEDCTIEWTNGTGISFQGDGLTLRRVRSHHNGQQGAAGSGRRFLLEEVTLDHNNLKGFDTDWEAGAIKVTHARDGVLRRCRADSNRGVGFWFDIDVRDILVEGCVAKDNAGHGIFVEISGGFVIRDNLCVRNGLDGAWGRGGIAIAESDHVTVEGNTCVLNPSGISIREHGPRSFRGVDGKQVSYRVHDLTIRRNVCARNAKYQFGLWWDNSFFGPHPSSNADEEKGPSDPDRASIRLEKNVYWCEKDERIALWGVPWRSRHKEYADLPTWQKERGQDAGSVVEEPRFTDPSRDDWTIAPSPLKVFLEPGMDSAPEASSRRGPLAPELGVIFLHSAGDSRDDGTIWAYRYRGAGR